jgi:hypothetical protein
LKSAGVWWRGGAHSRRPDFDVDTLGHGYYAQAAGVLHDMFDLLRRDAAPGSRQRLEAQQLDERRRYWAMVP